MGENDNVVTERICKIIHNNVDEKFEDTKADIKQQGGKIDTMEKAVLLLTEFVKDIKEKRKESKAWLYTVVGALVVNAVVLVVTVIINVNKWR